MITIKSLAITCSVAAVAIAMAMPAFAGCKAPVPESVASTLKDLRETASDAADHAAVLDTLSRSTDSWHSHASYLDDLKNEINERGRMLATLENERDAAAPIEREAIDRAHFLLRKMAENTTSAMHYLNDSPTRLWIGSYQKTVATLADESDQLYSTLGRFAQLARARAKEQNLQKSLKVEAGE